MSPQDTSGGPVAPEPPPNKNFSPTAPHGLDAMVRRRRGPRSVPGMTPLFDLDEPPASPRRSRVTRRVYASLYAPGGRRRRWEIVYICPHCLRGHFGFAESVEDAEGRRLSGCGRVVVVKVARVYGSDATPTTPPRRRRRSA